MSAHTPGPWIATPETYPGSSDYMIGRAGHKPDEVAVCSQHDARLIAAAPDLLAACKRALEQTDPAARASDHAMLTAAIAKAEGEK